MTTSLSGWYHSYILSLDLVKKSSFFATIAAGKSNKFENLPVFYFLVNFTSDQEQRTQ